MCEKCAVIDGVIERYKRVTTSISDDLTLKGAADLISELIAQKVALHPDQSE
jgi:hypothetical protein